MFLFFFQAEDGIRDWSVTGVQTCALPISAHLVIGLDVHAHRSGVAHFEADDEVSCAALLRRLRSEERRVGKEWRSGWSAKEYKKQAKVKILKTVGSQLGD